MRGIDYWNVRVLGGEELQLVRPIGTVDFVDDAIERSLFDQGFVWIDAD